MDELPITDPVACKMTSKKLRFLVDNDAGDEDENHGGKKKFKSMVTPIRMQPRKGDAVPIVLRLENLRTPFGISGFPDRKKGTTKYSLTLELPNDTPLQTFLRAFDRAVLKLVRKTPALIDEDDGIKKTALVAMYNPTVKEPKSTRYPPSIRLKLPVTPTGEFASRIYHKDTGARCMGTPLEEIHRGSTVSALVACEFLWHVGGKFGVTWKCLQLAI